MGKNQPYVDIRGYHKGVTGSCIRNTVHFSNGDKFRFLMEYGMYQGEGHKGIDYNDSITPSKIDAVIVTHTHLDHDGALPIFVRKGYTKNFYMTNAAACVIDIGLEDSYNIMVKDSKLKRQKILFSSSDIDMTLKQIKALKYEESFRIHPNITITFFNNGHLIGSSIVLVQIDDPKGTINLLYTGDYKPQNVFLDIKPLPCWVYALPNLTIITECTYGTTNSWDIEYKWKEDIINACSENKIIFNNAFGQGRFQELMYRIRKLEDEGLIPKDYPVKVDGSTGIDYTFRYISHSNVLRIKDEMKSFFPYNLQFVDNKSRPAVLEDKSGKIIIATSGMGTHGPAATYIPHFLSNPNALIYFTGYTSEGSTGRTICEANYGDEVHFKNGKIVKKIARVEQTSEFSSHAKADEIIDFLNMFSPRSILINHGEPSIKTAFEKRVQNETGVKKTGILGMEYVYRVNPYGIDKPVKK